MHRFTRTTEPFSLDESVLPQADPAVAEWAAAVATYGMYGTQT